MLLEKHDIVNGMLHSFNWNKWTIGKPTKRLALIPTGQDRTI